MKTLLGILILLAAQAAAQDQGARPQEGERILKASDEKLIPDVCSYYLTLTTAGGEGREKTSRFKGYKKHSGQNVLIVEEPKRISGTVHLRKQDIIWSYFTTNHKLTKVAYQAVFMGTLLNYGDVMATELTADYFVESMETAADRYVLELKPKTGKGGYGKIRLIVDSNTLLPVKREYYALSGILLKECEFKSVGYDDERLVFLEMEFYEPLKQRRTTAAFTGIEILEDAPDRYFNENFIKFLAGE